MAYDPENRMFQLALDLVNQSSRNIFLTGKAGTGKTTFLKYIRENCPKQMAVVAPTGVAAINAAGVTIHSFFQLPFGPFLPESKSYFGSQEEVVGRHELISRLRLTREKIRVLQQLELLIIDEISMVRCDTMDAIDTVLRHVRHRTQDRFGGVQVLFIGDMFQLPPVIKDQEWRLLADHYHGPYFFDSDVIRGELPIYIEFTKIYRQSEADFIRVLNQVRNNELDEDGIHILDKRVQPDFTYDSQDGYIVLTTHNEKARQINMRELQSLQGAVSEYRSLVQGDFPNNAYPAEEVIHLKVGAQVMFIKNDSDKSKRFFNGKIGIVKKLEKDKIIVQPKDGDEIEVIPEKWKNIRYSVNSGNRSIQEEELGSFTQFPLRLAWAITIHKSQGLTFEKAIIDAGEAFAAGQVYVALSRCTSLEGMVLRSRIRSASLQTDGRIIAFAENCVSTGTLEQELAIARKKYMVNLLVNTFDFSQAIAVAGELQSYLADHADAFNEEAAAWIGEITQRLTGLQAISVKFENWLIVQAQQTASLEDNSVLQTKVRDGADHFNKELQPVLNLLFRSPVVTDSKLQAKEFNEYVRDLFAELSLKGFLFKGTDSGLDAGAWHKHKNSFAVPPFTINAYAGVAEQKTRSPHPLLYDQLRKLRDSICSQKDMPIYMIASSKTLDEMATFLPQTERELEDITGFGKMKVDKYGQQFLSIITNYCNERQLTSRMAEKHKAVGKKEKQLKKEKASAKPDTKAESFRLYKQGHSIAHIAETRKLTVQTIEGHLSYFIGKGDIRIEEIISPEKLSLIKETLAGWQEGSIIPVKEKLGEGVSYGEIRMVIAWRQSQNGQEQL